jgi:hypothetical protein
MSDLHESTIHTGGCHCGNVRFEVETDLTPLMTCNCSICSKAGWWLTFVPAEKFKLISGQDSLSDYQFNKKVIHHLFCKTCGIRSFSRGNGPDGKETVAINVLCLDDVDLTKLTPMPFDGKSL